jgi:propanol-preferring alcohol dehydrogenase
MRAWHVEAPGPVTGHPLRLHTADDIPRPGPGELLLRVLACGVCRTDLHVTEGDLPPHRPGPPGVTPGHEVVGEVAALGEGAAGAGFATSDRAGAAWLRWTDGECPYCRRGAENLCPRSLYTGWDAADMPPEPLDAAILFAPVGDLVLPALAALDRGGTLAIAGIHLTDIPPLNYEKHLFQERQLRSVTVHPYPLDAADQAQRDLKAGAFDGAAVLIP